MLLRNCVRQQSRTATSKSAVLGWIAMTIWNFAVADRRRLRSSKTTCATGCFVNTIRKPEKRDGGITMRCRAVWLFAHQAAIRSALFISRGARR
jgi:hypothetical protein